MMLSLQRRDRDYRGSKTLALTIVRLLSYKACNYNKLHLIVYLQELGVNKFFLCFFGKVGFGENEFCFGFVEPKAGATTNL